MDSTYFEKSFKDQKNCLKDDIDDFAYGSYLKKK